MTDTYKELSQLISSQVKNTTTHNNKLIDVIKKVECHFAEELGLKGKTFKHEDKEHSYIKLESYEGSERITPSVVNNLNEDGSFFFRVVVVFTRYEGSIPDHPVGIPLAVKFEKGKAKYGVINSDTKEVFGWLDTVDELWGEVYKLMVKDFSFNPMEGGTKSSIGFI